MVNAECKIEIQYVTKGNRAILIQLMLWYHSHTWRTYWLVIVLNKTSLNISKYVGHEGAMKGFLILVLIVFHLKSNTCFSNFDDSCIKENEIKILKKEGRCATISHRGSKQLQWESCMKKLSKTLDQRCHGLGVSKVSLSQSLVR